MYTVYITTWKQLAEKDHPVVYGIFDGEKFPETVYIKYPHNLSLIEEPFPITSPDYNECGDYWTTLDKFNTEKIGVVSELETTGDVLNSVSYDTTVVIFDNIDIQKWIDKLQGGSVSTIRKLEGQGGRVMSNKLGQEAKALARKNGYLMVDLVLIQEAGFGYKLPTTPEDECVYYALDVSEYDDSEDSIGVHACDGDFDDEDGQSLYFGISVESLTISGDEVFADYFY
jgi:hypothetical protein